MSDSYERSGTLGVRCARDAVVMPRVDGCTPSMCVIIDATPAAVDLTALGITDWAKWGWGASAPGADRKAKGGGAIGAYSVIGGAAVYGYGDNSAVFSWSDGAAPHAAASAQGTGVYTSAGGYALDVAAAPGGATLIVFVGAWNGTTGRLNATLSDGSAPAFVDTSVAGPPGGSLNAAYRIDFASGTPGASLHVEWTVAAGGDEGNITLQGAAITDGATACRILRPTQAVCA